MEYLRKNGRNVFLLILFIFNITIWITVLNEKPKDFVSVSFLDVDQGDSILIKGRTGNKIMIDSGSGKSVLRQLSRELSFFDRFIDVAIVTHPDRDHIGGFPYVLNRYGLGLFMEPGVESDNAIDNEIDRILDQKNIQVLLARKGMVVDLMDGSYLEILFPDRDVFNLDTNDASIIARYVYGDDCVILTGDSPQKIENYIVNIFGSSLSCQILKAGHHGSKTSTGDIFLSAVSPEYVIISAGKDNSYGHPHSEVIERLKNFGAKILETSKGGSITFRLDGNSISIK